MTPADVPPAPAAGTPEPRHIWVDDVKTCPDPEWAVARTYDDALSLLRRYEYDILWLDHDLGDDGRTGLHLLRQLRAEGRVPPRVECISWNPVGRDAILAELADMRPAPAETPPAAEPPKPLGVFDGPECVRCGRREVWLQEEIARLNRLLVMRIADERLLSWVGADDSRVVAVLREMYPTEEGTGAVGPVDPDRPACSLRAAIQRAADAAATRGPQL